MAQPRKTRTLLSIMGDLEHIRPDLILKRGDHLVSILLLMNTARADIRQGVQRSINSITSPDYWLEHDSDGKVVIWRSTPDGPLVWMAEHDSKFVPTGDEP